MWSVLPFQCFFMILVLLVDAIERCCLLLLGKMRRRRRRRRRRRGSQDSTGESDSESWSSSSEYDSELEEEWDEERDWLGQLSPGGTTKTGDNSFDIRIPALDGYVHFWFKDESSMLCTCHVITNT